MKKLIITILKIAIFFIGWAVLAGVLPQPEPDNPALWRFWAELIPLLVLIVFTVSFWLIEKRTVKLYLFHNPIKSALVGITAGCIWLGATISIMTALGLIRYEGVNTVPVFALWFVSLFINTIMQELLVRGYLYQLIKREYNLFAAIIVTTAIFTFMHGGALEAGFVPVCNVVTMSILMSIVMEYTESLIAPIIMHYLWNSIGALILGGVSLADDYPHLLNMTLSGNELLSGGSCEMEGSVIVLAINIILCVFFTFIIIKKTKGKSSAHTPLCP